MSISFISLSEIRLSDNSFINSDIKSLTLFSYYYKEYYQEKYTDLSFAIMKKDQVLGYVACAVLDQVLTTPDGGITIAFINLSQKEQKKVYIYLLDYLTLLAKNHCCSRIIIKDDIDNSSLSPLGEILFNQRFKSNITFEMLINFSQFTEENFHAGLRKSYKSLISWGKKELKTDCINQNNLSETKFKEFQEFHYKISGRKTRSEETWGLQYQMIQEGIGELIVATYNEKLVAGSLFADYGTASIYFTGVYERELFQFGISHFLLYQGILNSYMRHQTSKFSLGYFDTDIVDPKWYNIQFFKKGFCKSLSPVIFWSKEINYESAN